MHLFMNGRVIIKVGDVTAERVDAVVNAANSSLMGGAGVDGAIHSRGGPAILDQCREIRRSQYPDGLPTGEAVLTTGGRLPASHVIHTVGPVYGQNSGRDAQLLAACYENCLRVAAKHGLRTIAFPAISTGIYSYPKSEAAEISSTAIQGFLERSSAVIEVRLVFYSPENAEIFLRHHQFQTAET